MCNPSQLAHFTTQPQLEKQIEKENLEKGPLLYVLYHDYAS
jgi:hypothetical protein